MTAAQWQIIDGTIDNEISTEVGEDDLECVADLGLSIREAGRAQVGTATGPVTITLTGDQWELVISALRTWSQVDEEMDDLERAAESRQLIEIISTQLDAPVPAG